MFICGERVKGRTVFKWAIGVIAIVVLIGVGAVVLLFVVVHVAGKGRATSSPISGRAGLGRWDFGQEPALFAVAQGIVKNDSNAIRAAAKNAPDLQAPEETAQHCSISLRDNRADPNQSRRLERCFLWARIRTTPWQAELSAMADAGHSSAPVLRAMLEAGGNANTRDEFGRPMILMNWYLGYYKDQADPGLNCSLITALTSIPRCLTTDSDSAGYPLLLYKLQWWTQARLFRCAAFTQRGAIQLARSIRLRSCNHPHFHNHKSPNYPSL